MTFMTQFLHIFILINHNNRKKGKYEFWRVFFLAKNTRLETRNANFVIPINYLYTMSLPFLLFTCIIDTVFIWACSSFSSTMNTWFIIISDIKIKYKTKIFKNTLSQYSAMPGQKLIFTFNFSYSRLLVVF